MCDDIKKLSDEFILYFITHPKSCPCDIVLQAYKRGFIDVMTLYSYWYLYEPDITQKMIDRLSEEVVNV